MALIMQEVSAERKSRFPARCGEIYKQWRPSPLYRPSRLEKVLGTPAKIYYKYEGLSPAGSAQTNTAVAQAFYNREAGVRKIATEPRRPVGLCAGICRRAVRIQVPGVHGQAPTSRSLTAAH